MLEKKDLALSEVVFEDFLVKYYTNLLKELKDRDDREFKEELIVKLLQNNLFLLRRLADPGFYRFICQEVLNDKKFLKTALHFIKKEIVLRLMKNEFFYDPFSKIEEWRRYNVPTLVPRLAIGETAERSRNYDEAFIKYFESQLKLAKVDGNLERIKAIEVVIKDYLTYKYNIHELLVDPFSSEPFTLNFIKHYETNLKNQKLKLHELYDQINPIILRSNYFVMQTYENQKIIMTIVEMISNILEIPPEQAILLNKFINDLISVIHFKWFDLREKEDKWKILYAEYLLVLEVDDFKNIYEIHKFINETIYDRDLVKKNFEEIYGVNTQINSELIPEEEFKDNLSDKFSQRLESEERILLYIITSFQQKGYFSNAIHGWQFLLTLKISDEINYICLKNIGNLNRKLGNYQIAVESFEQAIKTVKDDYVYHRGLLHRNLGVCYHYLENFNLKQSNFSKVEEIANYLDDIDKYRLLINLARGLEITNDFNEAYNLTLKITNSDIQNDFIFDLAYNKFQIYERHRLNDQHLDNKGLSKSLAWMDIQSIKNYFRLQKKNFQFTEARKTLEHALKIAKQNNIIEQINLILEDLAELFILTKNKEGFMDLFSNLKFNDLIPKVEIFKAVYLILNGEKDTGMEIFTKFYRNYFNIDCLSFTVNLSPRYNPNNINHDVMPILWFIKPFIEFSYGEINDLIDEMIQCLATDDDRGDLLTDIGRVYDQATDMESSIIQYGRGLKFIRTDINKRIVNLYNIAGAYVNLDDFKKAETYISKILKYFQDDNYKGIIKPQVAEVVFIGTSLFYKFNYDYPNAIKFIRKAKKFSNHPDIDELEQEYIWLNERIPFYNAIDDEKIKNLLYTSDIIFNKLSETSFEIDYSLIILGYCKAIEMLLDKKLTKKIDLSDILEPFYVDRNLKKIRYNLYKDLPVVLKAVLNYRDPKSIGIGQWPYVIQNLSDKKHFKSSSSNLIYFEFLNRLEKLIDRNKQIIIKESCENLFEYRNHSAHTKFHSKEEFLAERPKIISNINRILSIFQ